MWQNGVEMKRRTFLKAITGAVAGLFVALKVVAKPESQVKFKPNPTQAIILNDEFEHRIKPKPTSSIYFSRWGEPKRCPKGFEMVVPGYYRRKNRSANLSQ